MKNIPAPDTDHLRTFFLSMGKALDKSGLEAELAPFPVRAIRDWLNGRRNLAAWHRPKVEAWARRYGYNERTAALNEIYQITGRPAMKSGTSE